MSPSDRVNRLVTFFGLASEWAYKEGMTSYPRYNKLLRTLSTSYSVTLEQVAGIFSAISPNNDYIGNIRDTIRMLEAHKKKQTVENFKVSTYHNNKLKAWRILQGEDPFQLIQAKKTRNFLQCLVDPFHDTAICIDGHMFNIWNGFRQTLKGLNFRDSWYDTVAEDCRNAARLLNIKPPQFQGVVWHSWRERLSIKISKQEEFWRADYNVLGIYDK